MLRKLPVLLMIAFGFHAFGQEDRLSPEQSYNRALTAMGQGKPKEAINHLSKAIAQRPDYAEAYALRGTVRERLNDYKGALNDYTASLEFMPDQFEVLISRAALRYQVGAYLLAREDFNRLLTLPAGETNTIFYRRSAHSAGTNQMLTAQGAIHSQLFNYLGLIELELNNCHNAILHFDSAIQLEPQEADYYINRATARQECNRKDAVEDFRKALELDPNNPIARHNLAIAAARQGSYDLAEMELTEAIAIDSMILDPYLERGYYRMLRKDYRGALADYNRALVLEQKDPEIWLNRGVVREKVGDWVGAFSDYTQAIDLKLDFTKGWLNRGNLLMAQARYADAIDDYSAAIACQPDYAAAYFNRAIAFQRSGARQKACADVREARRLGYDVEDNMMLKFCGD